VGFTVTDFPVTAPTPALIARVVAPVTDQLRVLDWPVMILADVAAKAAIVGRVAAAAVAGDTPAKRRNTTVVIA